MQISCVCNEWGLEERVGMHGRAGWLKVVGESENRKR